MGYIKHEWKTGDVVSSVKLNEMENGIYDSNQIPVVSVPTTSTSNTDAKFLKVGDTEYKLGTGEGKIWNPLTLTPANLNMMITGNEVVGNFETPYTAENFKNDYFLCNIQQKSYRDAKSIWVGEQLNKVYVQTEGFNDAIAYVANSVVNAIRERGFDYTYYKTIVLYASNMREQGKTRDLGEVALLNATNVIYLQDVSQQGWEYNYGDPKYIEKMRREQLYSTEMGKAFAISIRGKDNTTYNCATFIYCMQSSQTSFWDSANGVTQWANIEAGQVYPVHFDNEHGTLRWMLDNVYKPEGSDEYYGVAMTTERKDYLRTTGIEFSKESVEGEQLGWLCSAMVVSKFDNIQTECLGNGINELNPIFSFNTQFGVEDINTINYIGRPNSHVFESIQYKKWKSATEYDLITEKDGYYLWTTDVDGIKVQLVIPDNYYTDEGATEPTPHRDTYFVRIDFSNINSTETIYRHTFTITTPNTIDIGNWELNLAMCAVNPDMGDSDMDYLLHSDETGESADWILPVSGTIGRVIGYGYRGDVINPVETYNKITLTPAYDLAKFEDLWDSLPKQLNDRYYIFYGNDLDQSRLINMRIEKENIDHAYDLYVYDDFDVQAGKGSPYIRLVTQAIGDVQKGFYMWDTTPHTWGTQPLDPSTFYELFNSSQGVKGKEKVEIEGETIFIGWDNSGLFEFLSSSNAESTFKDINVVAHTFNAMRMIAGWQTIEDKEVRTLFVDYIDKANEWSRAAVVTDYNRKDYSCRDFRSEVLMVKTPYVNKLRIK